MGRSTFGGREEECSFSTSPLGFKIMVLLVEQFEVICPETKHLKHFMELVLAL